MCKREPGENNAYPKNLSFSSSLGIIFLFYKHLLIRLTIYQGYLLDAENTETKMHIFAFQVL